MPGHPSSTDERASLAQLSQSSSLSNVHPTLTLAPIHRTSGCKRPSEGAKRCSSESGIMVLKQQTGPGKGALNRCYHATTPTVFASPSTITAWWPMPGCVNMLLSSDFVPLRACLRSIGQGEYSYQDSIHLRKVAGRQHNTVFMSTHNPNVVMALDS